MQRSLNILIVIFLGLFTASTSFANVKTGEFSLTANGGYYKFGDDVPLNSTPFSGITMGFAFNKYVEIEIGGSYMMTEEKNSGLEFDVYRGGADILFHIPSDLSLHPYLLFGAQAIQYNPGDSSLSSERHLGSNYGVGLQWEITERFDLKLEARKIDYTMNVDSSYESILVNMGLSFRFGGHEETIEEKTEIPVEVAVVQTDDDDLDGILNDSDLCPNSPSWMPVNELGCPKDTDQDGIFDFEDRCPLTEQGASVDANGCQIEQVVLKREPPKPMTLNIEFGPSSTSIDPKYHPVLDEVAKKIRNNPGMVVTIEGHTDSVGSTAINQKISTKRAEAVRDYLVNKKGIDRTTIKAVGYGEGQPIAENSSPAGRYKNRRITFKFSETP